MCKSSCISCNFHDIVAASYIINTLHRCQQLLISHSGANDAQAEAFMQGDEAGEEGSGSGRNYPDDDAAYDAEGSGEEGSGLEETGT